MSADAVLSVEIRAKMAELSKGLKVAEDGIDNFVLRGNDSLKMIEGQFKTLGRTSKEIAANMNAAFKNISFKEVATGALDSKKSIDGYKVALAQSRAEIVALKAEHQRLRNEFEGKKTAILASKNALEQEKISTQQNRTEVARLQAELQRLRVEKAQNRRETIAASGSYREAQQRLAALGRTIRETGGALNENRTKVRRMVVEYNELNNKLKQFDASMGNHQRNVGNYSSALAGGIPVLGQLATKAGIAALAYQGLQKSFDTNLKFDAIKYALKQISGSATEFQVNIDFLRESSRRLGLDFMSTMQAFKQWDGAVRFSNLTAEDSRRIFESVANAGAKMKLSTDEINGTFLALSQMISKGTVSMEELRRQLGDRLPGAFSLAAKAMGMSEMELNKLVSSGKLASEEFLPKFAEQLDKSFGNDGVEKIESMQASVARLKTEFDLLFESDRAKAFFSAIMDGISNMTSDLNKLISSSTWKEFALRLGATFNQTGQGVLMRANADLMNQAERMSKLTDIQRATMHMTKLTKQEREKEVESIKELLSYQTEQYKLSGNNPKWLENVKHTSQVLAEALKLQGELGDFKPKGKNIPEEKKKKEVDKIAEAYKNLSIKLKQVSADHTLTFGKKSDAEIGAYKTAINNLISAGVDPLDERITKLQSSIMQTGLLKGVEVKFVGVNTATSNFDRLTESIAKANVEIKKLPKKRMATASEADRGKVINVMEQYGMDGALGVAVGQIQLEIDGLNEAFAKGKIKMDDYLTKFVELKNKLNWGETLITMQNSMKQFASSMAETFGEAIGAMMVGNSGFDSFGKDLLAGMGKLLSSFGDQLVAFGIAAKAFGAAKAAIASGNPVGIIAGGTGAIVAGIALKVAGGIISGMMKGDSSTTSSSSTGNSAVQTVPKFAKGGIVSGPTLGLMGEYAGASSNPEVIAPLDKLMGMIRQAITIPNIPSIGASMSLGNNASIAMGNARSLSNGGTMKVEVFGEFRQRGSDMVATVDQARNEMNRRF